MQITLEITVLLLLTLAAIVGWLSNVVGMPGNWLVVLLAIGSFFFSSVENSLHVSLLPLILIILMALLGELLEFSASALGASRLGASKRASALGIGGAILGAIFGLFAGSVIPIPVLGQMLGSLLFGSIGAAFGSVLGERWAGKPWDLSLQVGHAAFWGRLLGTVGKAVCGTIVAAIYILAIWN